MNFEFVKGEPINSIPSYKINRDGEIIPESFEGMIDHMVYNCLETTLGDDKMINLSEAVNDYLEEKHKALVDSIEQQSQYPDYYISADCAEGRKQRILNEYNKEKDLYRPHASYHVDYGDDGRSAGKYVLDYTCPKCNKKIHENDIACTNCRIFFDWSKKAHVRTVTELYWE